MTKNENQSETAKPPQLLAIGFIQDARSYVEGAEFLEAAKGGSVPRLMAPTYYLLCHAIELALKAHLASCGVPKRKIRNRIGHDISLAFRFARRMFLFVPADNRFPTLVGWLSSYHLDHSFRYRKTGFVRLPLPSEAAEIISNTIGGIEPEVRRRFVEMRERERQ